MPDTQPRDDDDSPLVATGVAAAPPWISPELIEHTIRVWQPYYETPLQPEDAVTMVLGVGQLFDALRRG